MKKMFLLISEIEREREGEEDTPPAWESRPQLVMCSNQELDP